MSHQWNNSAPDCIQHNFPPGDVATPYKDCAGFFTWGPGRNWDAEGNVIQGGSTSLYILTAVGFAVSILAFVAWVWFENLKLVAQAARLRAAGSRFARPSPPQPGTTLE